MRFNVKSTNVVLLVAALSLSAGNAMGRTSVTDLQNQIDDIRNGQAAITPLVGDVAGGGCTAAVAGLLRWNAAERLLQVCDGTDWSTVLDSNLDLVKDLTNAICGEADGMKVENIPAGCEIDRSYYAFVTSAQYQGNLNGLSGADAKCQQLADEASLPGVYRAWLSTTNSYPSTSSNFTKPEADYVLPDGNKTVIANGYGGLTSGFLLHSINITEKGDPAAAQGVWTGTNGGGFLVSGNYVCSNWTSSATSAQSVFGSNQNVDVRWTYYTTDSCSALRSLYCFRQ